MTIQIRLLRKNYIWFKVYKLIHAAFLCLNFCWRIRCSYQDHYKYGLIIIHLLVVLVKLLELIRLAIHFLFLSERILFWIYFYKLYFGYYWFHLFQKKWKFLLKLVILFPLFFCLHFLFFFLFGAKILFKVLFEFDLNRNNTYLYIFVYFLFVSIFSFYFLNSRDDNIINFLPFAYLIIGVYSGTNIYFLSVFFSVYGIQNILTNKKIRKKFTNVNLLILFWSFNAVGLNYYLKPDKVRGLSSSVYNFLSVFSWSLLMLFSMFGLYIFIKNRLNSFDLIV